MSGCLHNYVYGGLLNIFDKDRLLKVIEYWKCSKCGLVKASFRNIDTTSPTYGLLPDPRSNEERWVVLVCGYRKDVELFLVRVGEYIVHTCENDEVKLYVDKAFKLKSVDREELENHYSLLLEEISPGYIDLSSNPVKIVKSIST
ncbi:MAG: hypothetical protein NZ929_04915 [Aigarchaeota archaeon]|nr:hypothetical protein [Aigarchaeota archaeon]